MRVPENFFDAAWQRSAALNRIIVNIAHSTLRLAFELARAKTISDVLRLQAEYWQKLFNAFHDSEFCNWSARSAQPRSPVTQHERATGESIHSQARQKMPSSAVMGTANQKPGQGSEQSSKRSTATRAPGIKRKAEKSQLGPKDHHTPSRKSHTGAQKRHRRQDTVSRGGRVEIQFGRLDDSAICFTSLEAWRFRKGSWRRIPVDKVLSDAVVLSKTRFGQLFPQVPQLPAGAFLPD